jgi:peptidoglycan hydrolase-like protein with peptidoglycan-binding domain
MGVYGCVDQDECHELAPQGGGGDSPFTPVAISASVGNGGSNRREDVRKIQTALNDIAAVDGGAEDSLVVDGWYGEKTGGAIYKFQKQQFPGWTPDVRIDPNQKTLVRINLLLSLKVRPLRFTPQSGPLSPELKKAYECVPGVLGRIRAARRRVESAQISMAKKPVPDTTDVRLAKWHFKAHKAADPVGHLGKVIDVFSRMESILFMETRAGSPFQLFMPTNGDPREKVAAAWAFLGGYSFPFNQQQSGGEYMHAIYIAPQFAEKIFAEMILLHELGHFCGGAPGSNDSIGHRAHPSPPPSGKRLEDGTTNYARMTPADALRNAQSFQFLCAPEHPLFMPPDPLPPGA